MSASASSKQDDPVVVVEDLYKSFGALNAVNGVSLSINKGEIFGFVGPNGGGKTTTIRMLCGILTPDRGFGRCLGFDLLTESYEIKKQIGYMTQKFSLYDDLSIVENLDFVARMYGMKNRRQAIQTGLDFLGLGSRGSEKLAGTLSGGWKQRLALAAAILHEPKLLLLDEPTIGIDPKARRNFWDEIHRLSSQGVTILVSTHYMDEAERSNRLAYINQGQVQVQGSAQQIVATSKLVTYEIVGEKLEELAVQLRAHADIEQVTNYGDKLHVCDTDQDKLARILSGLVKKKHQWREVLPDLEDVFIHYSTSGDKGA